MVTRTDIEFCNFCGKGRSEVRQLIAGPAIYICNECVTLCRDICEENPKNDNERMWLAKLAVDNLHAHLIDLDDDRRKEMLEYLCRDICTECGYMGENAVSCKCWKDD